MSYKDYLMADELDNCYISLYDELLNGEIRANDDFRILQYECAIRSVISELNTIINAEPDKPELVENAIKIIEKAGLNVVEEYEHFDTYYDEESDEHIQREWTQKYIWLDELYLDYPFLDKVKYYNHPIYDSLEDNNEENDCFNKPGNPSKLNIPISKSGRNKLHLQYRGLLEGIYDRTVDIKSFLKQFLSVLDADKKIINNNIQNTIDRFYVYDQFTFENKKISEITPPFNNKSSITTKRRWIKEISHCIKTYKNYHLNQY